MERHVKLFKNGRNQAVRIPREFELPGEDAIMRKEGDRLIIEPAPRLSSLLEYLKTLKPQTKTFLKSKASNPAGRSLMRYLLDTNIISDLVRNPEGAVAQRIAEAGHDNVLTSIIVASELRFGAAKKASPKLTARVDGILTRFSVMPFEAPRILLRKHASGP